MSLVIPCGFKLYNQKSDSSISISFPRHQPPVLTPLQLRLYLTPVKVRSLQLTQFHPKFLDVWSSFSTLKLFGRTATPFWHHSFFGGWGNQQCADNHISAPGLWSTACVFTHPNNCFWSGALWCVCVLEWQTQGGGGEGILSPVS